ncbi:unnamed protein product [Prorocentrum cordatum]|uniref:Uncharacterized protein n=1 Tax=Prorocentrum cordatum TaxID=2364126 RepID=A0ABN9UXX0_9DINO|nr:unnamed protein product [Polarella glacialis]
MVDRYLISRDIVVEGAAVPEMVKMKLERNAALAEEKHNAAAVKKDYAAHARKLVAFCRQAKSAGNFFVDPEAKLLFVVRIVGIIKLSPKLLRLKQLHYGVFLKLVQPYVTYGYPKLKTVISGTVGDHGVHSMENVVHEIYTVGPAFKQCSNFLWSLKLSPPNQRGGSSGNREDLINELTSRMN